MSIMMMASDRLVRGTVEFFQQAALELAAIGQAGECIFQADAGQRLFHFIQVRAGVVALLDELLAFFLQLLHACLHCRERLQPLPGQQPGQRADNNTSTTAAMTRPCVLPLRAMAVSTTAVRSAAAVPDRVRRVWS
jgi:hypothetical protein